MEPSNLCADNCKRMGYRVQGRQKCRWTENVNNMAWFRFTLASTTHLALGHKLQFPTMPHSKVWTSTENKTVPLLVPHWIDKTKQDLCYMRLGRSQLCGSVLIRNLIPVFSRHWILTTGKKTCKLLCHIGWSQLIWMYDHCFFIINLSKHI